MKREFLTDKIAFNYIDIDKFKSNYLDVSFVVPFDKRTSAMNSLFLKILKRGTKSYPNMIELSKKLEYLYSADIFTKSTCFGEVQTLSFAIDALDNKYALDGTDILGGAMEILKEIIFSPIVSENGFDDNYFESEKRNLLDDIAAEINNKAKYALGRICEHMFSEEKYRFSSSGEADMVSSLTNREVYEQYINVLDNARIEITFVGHADKDSLKAALIKMFSLHVPKHTCNLSTRVVREVSEVKEITEECIGKQGNLVMGFRTGTVLADGDYPKMALLCELYGGGASSMLFMNVREKMSLCYYCASVPEATKGVMFVRAGIENDKFETARDEIIRQLEALKDGKFSDGELSAAKLSLINAYREISDNPNAIRNWYVGRMLSNIEQSPAEAISVVKAITRDEIINTAKKIKLDTVYFLKGVVSGGVK